MHVIRAQASTCVFASINFGEVPIGGTPVCQQDYLEAPEWTQESVLGDNINSQQLLLLLEFYCLDHSRNRFRSTQEHPSSEEICTETITDEEKLGREREAHIPGTQADIGIQLALSSSRGWVRARKRSIRLENLPEELTSRGSDRKWSKYPWSSAPRNGSQGKDDSQGPHLHCTHPKTQGKERMPHPLPHHPGPLPPSSAPSSCRSHVVEGSAWPKCPPESSTSSLVWAEVLNP